MNLMIDPFDMPVKDELMMLMMMMMMMMMMLMMMIGNPSESQCCVVKLSALL